MTTQGILNLLENDNCIKSHFFLMVCAVGRENSQTWWSASCTLKMASHIIAIYIDDLMNVGSTNEKCLAYTKASINFLQSLGFILAFKYTLPNIVRKGVSAPPFFFHPSPPLISPSPMTPITGKYQILWYKGIRETENN